MLLPDVTVADSHADMINLRPEHLDPRARLIHGKPRPLSMIEGIEHRHYHGLFLIGYHTAAGEHGTLAHTINGRAFARITINNKVMSEADIYTTAAAEYNTPLLLVSGDNLLGGWIHQRYPSAHYVETKRAISRGATESLSPEMSAIVISETAEHAVQQARSTPPAPQPIITAPYHLELRATSPLLADLFSLIPAVERLDGTSIAYQASSMKPLIRLLSAFSYLASTQH